MTTDLAEPFSKPVQPCTTLYDPTPPYSHLKLKKSDNGVLQIEQIDVFNNVLQCFCPAKVRFQNVQENIENMKKQH